MEYLGPGAENVSPQAAAGILVERLKNSGHLGDRRDALEALLKLSKAYPKELGQAGGMPVFTDILRAGFADGGMIRTIMDIMLNLFSNRNAEEDGGETVEGANIAAFLQDVQNVQNLLDLLESQDTLAALSAVQVLQIIQKSAADSLEASILECPAGMQALVEVLRDPREEVRNEVILLLGQLTSSNLEVKKFVAFQEGFERLFDIMDKEGMLEGGDVIVKDCLDVCLNILTGSSLTKALFCQSKCLSYMHQLIDVRTIDQGPSVSTQEGHGGAADESPRNTESHAESLSSRMSPIQNEIACKALDLLLLILLPEGSTWKWNALSLTGYTGSAGGGDSVAADPKRADRQSAVARAAEGTLSEMIAHVGFSRADDFSRSTAACRERAMRVTGALVDGHATIQYNMGEMLVQDVGSDSLSLATLIMEGALGEGEVDPAMNELFHWVLGCFFHGNELGCAQVVSHVIAPPPPPMELELDIETWVPPTPPGKVLVESLAASAGALFSGTGNVGSDVERNRLGDGYMAAADTISRGCMILSMLFRHGGGATKEIALRVPVASPSPTNHLTTLLQSLLRWLEQASSYSPTASATEDNPDGAGLGLAAAIGSGSLESASAAARRQDAATRGASAIADAAVSLLKLLCRWLHDCPAAIRELLENPANLFVVDVAAGRCSLSSLSGAGGGWNEDGRVATTARKTAAVKGLTCLMLGILLEHVEGPPSMRGRSGSGANGGAVGGGAGAIAEGEIDWNRQVVMKMIQHRVGITPFMASIEATKRAFAEAESNYRRRARAQRRGKDTSVSAGAFSGALRLDPSFTSLLNQAAEEVRRRVIALFTHGGGVAQGGDGSQSSSGDANHRADAGASGGGGGAGWANVVEMQESEIATLKHQLSEALSRVPMGGGEGGGVSALEAALKRQVGELLQGQEERLREMDGLKAQLSDALSLVEEERESGQQLFSEVEGLSVTVSSLERQLMDREREVEGLRRQIAAGGDQSLREEELTRQVAEARTRASNAEDELERGQRQFRAEAEEDLQTVLAESEAKWSNTVAELQVALDEARAQAGEAALVSSRTKPNGNQNLSDASIESERAELPLVLEELNKVKQASAEREVLIQQLQETLAETTNQSEASQQEMASLREAVHLAQSSLEEERETADTKGRRLSSEVERLMVEAEGLRQELDSTVRRLGEADSGGSQQVQALQKELVALRKREEQEAAQWRRRLDEAMRLADEETMRNRKLREQDEQKLNHHWKLQIQQKEGELSKLDEKARQLERGAEATSGRIVAMEEDDRRLRERADLVDVLEARCSRLEEAAATAAYDVENRLRSEIERERESAAEARGSAAAIEEQLQQAKAELMAKVTARNEVNDRLDEVQAYLSQIEDDRAAAEEREKATLHKLGASEDAIRLLERRTEEAAQQAAADLEDRDGVIAAVEDARVAQEAAAENLQQQLNALNYGPPQAAPGPRDAKGRNGWVALSSGADEDDSGLHAKEALNGSSRDDMVDGEEYLDLLSEHEDLLQLLAQQELVRKTLLTALTEHGGQHLAKAVMADAEALVTNTYGGFVRYTNEEDDAHAGQPQHMHNGRGRGETGESEGMLRSAEKEHPPSARGRVAV